MEPAGETKDKLSSETRIQRIGQQTRGLVDDVKAWVELRMELTQIQVEDRVEERINEATSGVAVGLLGALGILFLLLAASIALGEWLGYPALGFLIVGGVILLITIALHVLRPRFVQLGKERSDKK